MHLRSPLFSASGGGQFPVCPVNQELGRANGHGGDWHAAISLLRSRISGPTLDGAMS